MEKPILMTKCGALHDNIIRLVLDFILPIEIGFA